MDKLLSKKEKRVSRKEKVNVGVPKMKKRKAQAEDDAEGKSGEGKKGEKKKGESQKGAAASSKSPSSESPVAASSSES